MDMVELSHIYKNEETEQSMLVLTHGHTATLPSAHHPTVVSSLLSSHPMNFGKKNMDGHDDRPTD